MSNTLQIGHQQAMFNHPKVEGNLIEFEGDAYYKISNSDAMRPFFMSIVSASNHWMFVSSNGGLSAGRKNSDNAIFPYYTDDKITEFADITGSKTIMHVIKNGVTYLWEPFSDRYAGVYAITRNLYKNKYGNKLVFEEHNKDLKLTFRYHWNTSDEYGFIKKSELINNDKSPVNCTVLDGLQNILPAGVGEDLQKASSNLVDAYKRTELKESSGIGMITLSAIIVDKAEPSEALRANLCWSIGLENPTYLLSSNQLNLFRKGQKISNELDVKAQKGAYFTKSEMQLAPEQCKSWWYILDVNKSIDDVHAIDHLINNNDDLKNAIQEDIDLGTQRLVALTAASDGLQITEDPLTNNRHFANTLFNIMRGGIFDSNYHIERSDFITYLNAANKDVYTRVKTKMEAFPELFELSDLHEMIDASNDNDLRRLCIEYLPLKFSRRHGDPSRPWNKFSINTRSEIDGSKILDYEGNWRDIFQNWEALAHSYPQFIEGMIHKFLNATTFDGYNPYRVTKGGFDWEVIEEDDPWSYIGYWGDHQIIYLLKFLEFIENYHPGELNNYLTDEVFAYANVPYTIKSYQEICANPKDTIDFDHRVQEDIEQERERIGADGALLKDAQQSIYKVNFLEKILATSLAKISNFIPEAGIWLNTQRPEWNDANNALVGNGVSMVTLYYLRRFLTFIDKILNQSNVTDVPISVELAACFNDIYKTLESHRELLKTGLDDHIRKNILDGLGNPASNYRERIYKEGFRGEKTVIKLKDISEFIATTLTYIDHTIEANKRMDNMYHAYNIVTISDKEVSISYLPEMLEGQVAVLSSGYLTPEQSLAVMDGLKNSALFRPDQYSYILYPNKELKGFEEKNNIPTNLVQESAFLKQLVEDDNKQVITKDLHGNYHFNSRFTNVNSLRAAVKQLEGGDYDQLIKQDLKLVEQIFEKVFNHKAFTGRSGTFFGYEGLGSIYWHMVSKLLLAVQETTLGAIENGANAEITGKMLDHYYEIQAGIGVHKSPELYGAFPTDPYSHTPLTKGAQQPGMTGQVKEDILCRIGELGVKVIQGQVVFKPELLRKQEFLTQPATFNFIDVHNHKKTLKLLPGSLAFTYCQVPVVYHLSEQSQVVIYLENGNVETIHENVLNTSRSKDLFRRNGVIERIEVSISKGLK